jgi:hypothetical protein
MACGLHPSWAASRACARCSAGRKVSTTAAISKRSARTAMLIRATSAPLRVNTGAASSARPSPAPGRWWHSPGSRCRRRRSRPLRCEPPCAASGEAAACRAAVPRPRPAQAAPVLHQLRAQPAVAEGRRDRRRRRRAPRQLLPQGTGRSEQNWTCLGYADHAPKQRRVRLEQSNLMGPAGFISMEDGARYLDARSAPAGRFSARLLTLQFGLPAGLLRRRLRQCGARGSRVNSARQRRASRLTR